jgi:hypothetical protein
MGTNQTMDRNVRDEVARTLASLDHLAQLEAGPDFLPRLRARMAATGLLTAPPRRFPRILMPALRPALLALLLLVNLLTIAFVARANRSGKDAGPGSVMAVAADYSLTQDADDLLPAREENGR